MKWRIGDLGRFASEDPSRPRFEVVAASKEGITVWYGGERRTRVIPVQTFKRDCVNWWIFESATGVHSHFIPKWFGPGALFQLHGQGGSVVQAVLRDRYGFRERKQYDTVHVRDVPLEVRQVRFDYASCLAFGDTLIMVPISSVVGYGYRVQTRWDKLQDDDDVIDELYDLYDDF